MRPKAKPETYFASDEIRKFFVELASSPENIDFFVGTLGEEGQRLFKNRLNASPDGEENLIDFSEMAELLGFEYEELSPIKLKTLELNTLTEYFAARNKLLVDHSISVAEAARLLKITPSAVHKKIKENKLIGLIDAHSMRIPKFQLEPFGPNGTVEGLAEVIKAMPGSTLSKINWLVSSNTIFEGQAPVDVLRQGKIDDVLREARAVGVA